jgi:UDP-2,3-diacylglucosamine hydrolase
VGRRLAEYDIGQTVVIAEAACVAVEAMEGTDATIERAGEMMRVESADRRTRSVDGGGSDCSRLAEPGA